MPNPIRIEGMLAKIESVYGTDPTPVVGSDAVRVSDRLWNAITPAYAWENTREDMVSGTLVPPAPAVPRGRHATLDFGWEIKGSRSGGAYSAGNKIEADPLLRACCMAAALSTSGGSESLTYTRLDASHESCTIWVYAAGWLYKLTGCRGVVSWPVNVGVLSTLRFRMSGFLATAPAVATLPGGIVYSTPGPLAGVNLAMSIGGIWTPDVMSAEWTLGNTISRLESANATDGIQSFDSGGIIQPTFRLSAKAMITTIDPEADKLARTTRTLSMQYGTVQYNKAKLTSTLYTTNVRNTEQNGFAGWDIDYITDGSDTIFCN